MFGSTVLEVAIGLAGVYAMVSLVCTAANELLSSIGVWRAKTLAEGIRNLLGESTAREFYEHPLILGLYRKGKMPSYIPSRTFALALMDLMMSARSGRPETIDEIRRTVDASSVSAGLKRVMSILIEDARNTIATGRQLQTAGIVDTQKLETAVNHVHENVEVWFNNSMERVAGWYKRKTQAAILVLAVVFTVALNVDTILIINRLSYDAALRQVLVAQAEKLVADSARDPAADSAIGARVARLQATGLPLGWGQDVPRSERDFWWYLTKLFGLLLTAGAASLGAPFWFDVLNKIITVRSAGKAPEESPKSPKEIPRPLAPGQVTPPTDAGPAADAGAEKPKRGDL
jgi:hypothetical protein